MLERHLTRKSICGGNGLEASNLVGAVDVGYGENLEFSIQTLEFLTMVRKDFLAMGLSLFPDAQPALRISFSIFPTRFFRPIPRQDFIPLFLEPRMNLRF